MGETPWQMKEEIEVRRQNLEKDIHALQSKVSREVKDVRRRVKRTFDWREQVGMHTGAAIGIAFAAGILLAVISPRRRRP